MKTWYDDGLYFECQRCGNCCSGNPGHVWVNDEEIAAIARHLGMSEEDFRACHTVIMGELGTRLTERENNDCLFFNREYGCVIYELRPRQCVTWPFWRGNLATPERWQEMAQNCPGINRDKYHGLTEIRDCLNNDGLS